MVSGLESAETALVVIDFGYAAKASTSTSLSGVAGSPEYAPPEVLDWLGDESAREEGSAGYGSACDMWSVGVTLYVLLMAAMPMQLPDGCPEEELAAAVRQAKLAFNQPEWRAEGMPAAREFITACMQVDPSLRPSARDSLQSAWLVHDTSAVWPSWPPQKVSFAERITKELKRRSTDAVPRMLPSVQELRRRSSDAVQHIHLPSFQPKIKITVRRSTKGLRAPSKASPLPSLGGCGASGIGTQGHPSVSPVTKPRKQKAPSFSLRFSRASAPAPDSSEPLATAAAGAGWEPLSPPARRSEAALEGLRLLKQGCRATKYSKRGKPHACVFRLSDDERTLTWEVGLGRAVLTRAARRSVDMSDVVALQIGFSSEVMKRHVEGLHAPAAHTLSLLMIHSLPKPPSAEESDGSAPVDTVCLSALPPPSSSASTASLTTLALAPMHSVPILQLPLPPSRPAHTRDANSPTLAIQLTW